MIDPLSVLDDVCAGLEIPGFSPSVPGGIDAAGNGQVPDEKHNSRNSRSSRSEIEAPEKNDFDRSGNTCFESPEIARASSYQKVPGTPGTPGTGAKTLAETTLSQFPVKSLEPGTPGTGSGACERPLLDLNRAAPQRSDWWTGGLMAEVDRLVPPPGDPLPISPTDVRAGVARELRALADLGRTGPDALRDAIKITRAKIRNSEALAERQANGAACHVCDEPLDDILPVIAVLSGKPGAHLFLHAACHDAYRARRATLVDRIMASAGYGETLTNGEAA